MIKLDIVYPCSGQYLNMLLGTILDDSRIRGDSGMNNNVLGFHVVTK